MCTYGLFMLMYGRNHHNIAIILQLKLKFKNFNYCCLQGSTMGDSDFDGLGWGPEQPELLKVPQVFPVPNDGLDRERVMRASGGRERGALLTTRMNTSPATPELQRQRNVFILQLMETIHDP